MNRYEDLPELKTKSDQFRNKGTVYISTPLYPEIQAKDDDILIITEWGDRVDNLAHQFYGDITLYWIIMSANPNKVNLGSYFVPVGVQMRIPRDTTTIIDAFNTLNEQFELPGSNLEEQEIPEDY